MKNTIRLAFALFFISCTVGEDCECTEYRYKTNLHREHVLILVESKEVVCQDEKVYIDGLLKVVVDCEY